MSLQGKSRRRLLFILIGVLVLSGLAGGAALVRLQYIRQRALRGRVDGLAAMAQGDYPNALTELGKYLSRYPNDADILLPYAKARQSVEEPNGHHLGQAVALYQRVLELRPGLAEAQQSLLDLYIQIGFNTEANELADKILAQDQDNTNALRAKVVTSMRMRKGVDAKTNVLRLTKVAPLNLEFRILELQVVLNTGGQKEIVDYANRVAQAYPNDARFELLKSIAASMAGDSKSAINLIRPLVASPQVDAVYTRMLIRQLDSLELFNEASTVIEQAAKGTSDRDLTRAWIRRLFETNRLSLLVEQTNSLDPLSSKSDAEILGMRALALARLNRSTEATQILAALDKRATTEPPAGRWATALRATALRDTSDPMQTITKIRDALVTSPGNPILLQELGEAYASAGAHDKASATWREVTHLAPAWAAPLLRLSQSFITAGRPIESLEAARAAQLRAPDDHDVLVGLAVASAANLQGGASDEAAKVLELIASIQRRFPTDVELLPLQAGVLAQVQRQDAAIQVIHSALAANPVPPERILLSLAEVSETFRLGQEEACWALGQKAYGLTADLAYAHALWLHNHQRAPEGLALLQQALAAHPANDPLWQSVWAEYLDHIGDDRAQSQWLDLGERNPKNVKLQWAALSARSVQVDHEFVGRTINRLIDLLGEDSLTLRLVRARWLLQGRSNDNDTTQASILLSEVSRGAPDMVAPRLLLATCYMRLGNTSEAIDQLVAVSDMQPDLARVALEVARLLQARGDFSRARQYIDRASHSPQASLQDIRQASRLLAEQGDFTAALALLEKAYGGNPPPDLMLAALYRQLGQLPKTADVCQKLLEKPDEQAIAFAADFYASQNRMDDAQRALAMLGTLKLPAGRKELILASYAARFGSPEDALKQFQAAAQAAPHDAAIWQQLIMYCLGMGKIDDALAAADDATRNVTNATDFQALHQNAALVKEAAGIVSARPLIMTLVGAPTADAAVLDALHIIVDAKKTLEPVRQTAGKVRQLAEHNPRTLALQTVALQLYMDAGQIDEAVGLAARTVQTFPSAVEPLREATNVFRAAGRLDEALNTAQEWRRRDPGEALDADLAIAGTELQRGEVSAATQQIQPYLDRAIQDPEKFSGVIVLRAQELLATHQPDKVEALLSPLLAKSPFWRGVWLRLAVRGVDDPKLAQAWIEQVSPMIANDPDERALLAEAWIAIGKRWTNAEFGQNGRKMLEAVAMAPDVPMSTLLAWGSTCEDAADWAGAEQAYRRAIQRDPKTAVALNNLANVLVRQGGSLDEAQQLVAKALALDPQQPAFLDTKATVQAAKKDYQGAVATLREAQRIDPQRLEWHVNLLVILADSGQIPAARDEMQKIALLLPTSTNTPTEVRQRFEALRAKLQ